MSDFDFSNKDLEEGLREFDTKPKAPEPDVFDLKSLGENTMADLKKFKQMRADMVQQRALLDARIKIMDKRIEIAISAASTLQRPV